jgi:GTP-binding protein
VNAPFPQLRFLMSASRAVELPPCHAEVAFVGRSNVGKSSVLNAVTGRKEIARVSRTPGRTQLINVFEAAEARWIVDLPGYGFAAAPGRVRSTWQPMIEGYLTGRRSLRMVFVLIDAEIGPTTLDEQMVEWLAACGVPFHVVANKVDKVGKSRHGHQHARIAEALGRRLEDVSWVSAAKGTGVVELRKLVAQLLD